MADKFTHTFRKISILIPALILLSSVEVPASVVSGILGGQHPNEQISSSASGHVSESETKSETGLLSHFEDTDPLSDALRLYNDRNFEEALELFLQIKTPFGFLFSAKSAYALGYYHRAVHLGSQVRSEDAEMMDEALYVRALAHYQLKEFTQSLELLHHLRENSSTLGVQSEAVQMYEAICSYLSFDERIEVIRGLRNLQIGRDLVAPWLERYDSGKARELVGALAWRRGSGDVQPLMNIVDNMPLYFRFQGIDTPPPPGTIYKIGILMPSFEDSPEDRPVSSGLFYGVLMAVDEFNRRNTDQKIQLYFADSGGERDNPYEAWYYLVNEKQVDAIIGPLFSNHVNQLIPMAERRKVPMFAPLANAVTFPPETKYAFQVNPGLESRGRRTARFAVEELGFERMGVIVEQGSLGEMDARAFRDEAELLGAEIPLYFSENFAARGYYLGDLLPWFATNEELIDTISYRADSLDAIYLPFTGNAASTLLDLALTGLHGLQINYVIFGNEELRYLNHSPERIRALNMLYSDTFHLVEGSADATNFRYEYINRTGMDPNMFSYIGYDIGNYFISLLSMFANPANIPDYIRFVPEFTGLSTMIHFGSLNVNQALHFFRYTRSGPVLVDPEMFRKPPRPEPDHDYDDEGSFEFVDPREGNMD